MIDAPNTINVLIVCTGNTCRSPMAAAIARDLLGGAACVQSAGMETGEGLPATKEAIAVMKDMGYYIENHRSRDIGSLDVSSFTLIIAMTEAIDRKLRTLGMDSDRIVVIDVPDPYMKGIDAYRSTARILESRLRSLLLPPPTI